MTDRPNPQVDIPEFSTASSEPSSAQPRNQLTDKFPVANLTVLAHFYRGEVARSNIWRQRMDITTNWAIVSATAAISVAFSSIEREAHIILPFASLIVFMLLHIEGRRYRFYDVWRTRVRMLECHLLVPTLLPENSFLEGNWRQVLSEDLLMPSYKISYFEAVGRRMLRNYVWIFLLLLIAWVFKVLCSDKGGALPATWGEAYGRFGWGAVAPWVMLLAEGMLHFALLVLLLGNLRGRSATGEIRRRDPERKVWPI